MLVFNMSAFNFTDGWDFLYTRSDSFDRLLTEGLWGTGAVIFITRSVGSKLRTSHMGVLHPLCCIWKHAEY
jgi:hypothetical protein